MSTRYFIAVRYGQRVIKELKIECRARIEGETIHGGARVRFYDSLFGVETFSTTTMARMLQDAEVEIFLAFQGMTSKLLSKCPAGKDDIHLMLKQKNE